MKCKTKMSCIRKCDDLKCATRFISHGSETYCRVSKALNFLNLNAKYGIALSEIEQHKLKREKNYLIIHIQTFSFSRSLINLICSFDPSELSGEKVRGEAKETRDTC